MGGVARAMLTMGLYDLALVSPVRPPDHPDAVARAVAAAPVLAAACVVDDLAAAVADCEWVVGLSARSRAAGPPALDVRDAAGLTATRASAGARVAWVFGSERDGLSNDELHLCQARAHIPTSEILGSLNLAAAVQVGCYELHRALRAPAPAATAAADPPAPRAAHQAIADRLHAALVSVGRYSETDGRTVAAERRFLRALDRLAPSEAEVRAIHAMLKWLGH